MEVDGRKLRKSLFQGSDDVHDFPCSPCAKEGKNVAAAKHCVECDENMCSTCLDHHNKFSSMKGHQLLEKVKAPCGERLELPSQRCDKHGGKLIEIYCPGHDKVGCSTCIAVDHSTCRGISFIPDIAKHSKSSEELQQLETAINSLQSRCLALKQTKQADLVNLKQEKDQLQQEIKSERKKINSELDRMEKELLNEVGTTFHVKMQKIDSDIKEVEDTHASLQTSQQNIQAAKNENESEKYVQIKLGHERKKIAVDSLENLEGCSNLDRLWFDPYNQVTGSRKNIIGRVIHHSTVEVGGFTGEYDVRISGDEDAADIRDVCLDADGSILITDYKNKRIKKLNETFTVTSYFTVNDNPFGVCEVDSSLLAVTLTNKKKVQFVSKDPMTLQNSFKVGDRCRGIAYNSGLIYVCCGGSHLDKDNESSGHLEVYNLSGELLRSYYGEIDCPCYVAVPSLGMEIYVTDVYSDVLIINNSNMKHIFRKNTKLNSPRGISFINKSQMCIGGCLSNNIVLMSCDGKISEELLTEKDGITNALGVCFDATRSRMAVSSFGNNVIKVYNLNIR